MGDGSDDTFVAAQPGWWATIQVTEYRSESKPIVGWVIDLTSTHEGRCDGEAVIADDRGNLRLVTEVPGFVSIDGPTHGTAPTDEVITALDRVESTTAGIVDAVLKVAGRPEPPPQIIERVTRPETVTHRPIGTTVGQAHSRVTHPPIGSKIGQSKGAGFPWDDWPEGLPRKIAIMCAIALLAGFLAGIWVSRMF